ncbi:MAG: polysaccharide deacetylase family protein [Proteobacteria bacterium]|nr:polysaccharide deacetylase family protein [Pseudomonadota bacterium]MCG2829715.1 polysaccharide deacetylase family protein [Desulfobacteraceae bacterium]
MQRVFILLYHKVDYKAPPFFGVAVRPDVFERQIRFLKRYYKIVDLSALNQSEQINRTYSTDVIVITFDDGYRNNYKHAFPILKKYNVPATIFLATDYIGNNRLLWYDELSWILYKAVNLPDSRRLMRFELSPEIIREVERFLAADSSGRISILRSLVALLKAYSAQERDEVIKRLAQACRINKWPGNKDRPMLSWDEVRDMAAHGISFGSHTMSHPVLSTIPMSEVKREIGESKRIIEEQIQKPVTTFAYPYGKYTDYTDEVTKVLFDGGFEYACTTTVGYEQFPVATPLKLKRRGVPPHPYLFL